MKIQIITERTLNKDDYWNWARAVLISIKTGAGVKIKEQFFKDRHASREFLEQPAVFRPPSCRKVGASREVGHNRRQRTPSIIPHRFSGRKLKSV